MVTRTTVNLSDDLKELVRSLAAKRISLDRELADVGQRGRRPKHGFAPKTAFPCFSIEPEAPPITLDQTLAAEDEL
jgi:hypothetical protein